jgi:hypothetical protein
MNTVCTCGTDCGDFLRQHAIQSNAIFACPVCDTSLVAQWVASASTDATVGAHGLSGDDAMITGTALSA